MRRWDFCACAILIGFLGTMCFPSAAVANPQADQGSGITVTPRYWLSTVDPLVGVTAVVEAYSVPSYGATVSYCPQGTSEYSISVTGLWGEGTGDAVFPGGSLETSVNGIPFSMASTATMGESNGKRTDFELLVRRSFPDKWLSLFVGLRYATWRQTTTARLGYEISVGPILGQTLSDDQYADLTNDLESKYYGLELGFGTVAPLGGNGRHSLTTDFAIAAARTEWETTVELSQNLVPVTTFLDFMGIPDPEMSGERMSTALDVAAGYRFKDKRFGCSFRYKLMVVFEENALEIPQLTAVSGPEAWLSVSF